MEQIVASDDGVTQQTMVTDDSPRGVARDALTFAIDFCRTVMNDDDPVSLLQRNDARTHEYLRYGLACRLAERVGASDPAVKAIYVGDWDSQPDEVEAEDVDLTSPLTLIIRVSRRTEALESLLAQYDAAVTQEYRALIGSATAPLHSLLDAKTVDDQEVRSRDGSAALLTAVREHPIMVWDRQRA